MLKTQVFGSFNLNNSEIFRLSFEDIFLWILDTYRNKMNSPCSMCSLVVSILDSPDVDPRSNPGSDSALLMSEKSQVVYYISRCHMLIDRALSSDKPNSHWFEADWLHCKRDALSSNRKVDGSRLTGSTQACHSWYGNKNTGDD